MFSWFFFTQHASEVFFYFLHSVGSGCRISGSLISRLSALRVVAEEVTHGFWPFVSKQKASINILWVLTLSVCCWCFCWEFRHQSETSSCSLCVLSAAECVGDCWVSNLQLKTGFVWQQEKELSCRSSFLRVYQLKWFKWITVVSWRHSRCDEGPTRTHCAPLN